MSSVFVVSVTLTAQVFSTPTTCLPEIAMWLRFHCKNIALRNSGFFLNWRISVSRSTGHYIEWTDRIVLELKILLLDVRHQWAKIIQLNWRILAAQVHAFSLFHDILFGVMQVNEIYLHLVGWQSATWRMFNFTRQKSDGFEVNRWVVTESFNHKHRT